MTIDLATPLWGGITAGIVLMIIAGTYHYIRTLVQLNFTEKKLSNIISEMDSLNTKYKKQITSIQNTNLEITKNIFAEFQKQIKELVQKYHRLVPPAKLAFLEHWDNKREHKS